MRVMGISSPEKAGAPERCKGRRDRDRRSTFSEAPDLRSVTAMDNEAGVSTIP